MAGSHVPPSESGASGLPWDAVLDGQRPPETEDEMKVAQLAAALRAPGTPEELRGADVAVSALLAHRAAVAAEGAAVVPFVRPSRRRAAVLVAAGLTGTVLLAGTAAAAATGSLPRGLQSWLHEHAGAPAPVEDVPTPTTGPSQATSKPGNPSRPGTPASSRPASGPTASNPVASSHLATTTPPGQTKRPTTPPGQTKRPTTPPGQTKRPTTPPGQTKRPTTPPGQTKRPTTPPGQTVRPTEPPGQTQRATVRPSPTKTKASTTAAHT